MKNLNEEINKIKHLFTFKKGDVITESVLSEDDKKTYLSTKDEKMAKHFFKKPVDFGIRIDDKGTKYFWMTDVLIPGGAEFPLKSDGSMADFNKLVSKIATHGKSYFKNLDSEGNPDGDALNLTLKSMLQTALKDVNQLPG
jgi:hypothetical protein